MTSTRRSPRSWPLPSRANADGGAGTAPGHHVFLWSRANDARMNATARAAVSQAPLVLVSAASAWEAAIAQASLEDLVLVTHDRLMEPYGTRILWT